MKKRVRNLAYVSVGVVLGFFSFGEKIYGGNSNNEEIVYEESSKINLENEIEKLREENQYLRGAKDYPISPTVRSVGYFYNSFIEKIVEPILPGKQTLSDEEKALRVIEQIDKNNKKIDNLQEELFTLEDFEKVDF